MFQSEELNNHLKFSHTIDNNQAVWMEINMNQSYNIDKVGNYRYRPGSTDPTYGIIPSSYDENDIGNYYTGATDSDTVINAGFDDNDEPAFYVAPKKKIGLLYSLDDCFKQNRPRSGINKLLYLGIVGAPSGFNQYIDSLTTRGESENTSYLSTVNIARRPRYYMASRYDEFKYWTSYRTEVVDNVSNEYGIAINQSSGSETPSYYIYDAAPFVIYKNQIPANKIVIKVQTNVGDLNNGPFRIDGATSIPDPLYGQNNSTTPKRWALQKLDENNNWVEVVSFTEESLRGDGSPIIGSDGYVELEYGLSVPSIFQDVFTLVEEIYSTDSLPDLAPYGYAYLYKEFETDRGVLYISDGGNWQVYQAEYSWQLASSDITKNTKVVKKFSNPDYFEEDGKTIFREFDFLNGLRIVVDTMNKVNSTFDLIELSPRILGDVTDRVETFSVTKTLSDLANHSMPTGSLLASTGQINMFDDDFAFNDNNVFDHNTKLGSILSGNLSTRIKFLFYDIVKNVNEFDYYLPIKTLYSESMPSVTDSTGRVSLQLRDLFYLLESKKSPELLLTNVSLSYAITVLLDNIGFSNYVFKRTEEDEELIIPYFFVGPDQNIAETLQQLAISSQTAMFFDEYNNFVVMSKNYILPSSNARPTDIVLYGQEESVEDGVALPNIMSISAQEKKVYNGGEINYTTRYIQRSIGSISQAPYTDEYKTYVYKPVLLWEVAGQEATKTINESSTQSSGYSLSAMPIKTSLSSNVPQIVEGEIINNIIDFGENIYWLGNYSGYFYANGEVIRYDAVEYSVAGVGNVWIKNNQEYQNYFGQLKFNGKMYPTGRVRIYTNIDGTEVVEHGRGQFGTEITTHPAGVEETTWISDNNVRGCIQNAKDYLFNTNKKLSYPINLGTSEAGKSKTVDGNTYTSQSYAIKSTRNGIIKNFMANVNLTELDTNYYKTAKSGSVQTSALVFNGPSLPEAIDPAEFVTYSYKQLDKPYKHFGTRMRIIGKIDSGTNKDQSPIGAFELYPASELTSIDPSKQISIAGGSGGIAFGLNKDTNIGYYFEIAALTQNTVSSYKNNSNQVVYNINTAIQTQAINDVVTVTLKEKHDFNIGTTVVVSGLSVSGINRFNGEFSVTSISQDRKQFQYKIPSPTVNQINVTSAVANGKTITYTAEGHRFIEGQVVSISDIQSNPLGNGNNQEFMNLSNVQITSVSNPVSVSKDVIEKQLSSNVATLKTSEPHSFSVNDFVEISGVDSTFNGTYIITSVPDNDTFTYEKVSSDVALTAVSPAGSARIAYNDTFTVAIPESNIKTITKKKLVSNVATITTSSAHGFSVGNSVGISGVDSVFDGTYIVASVPSSTTLTYSKVSGDVSEQSSGGSIGPAPSAFDQGATAEYVPFSATTTSGGTVTQSLESDTLISDVFFYKIVSDENGNAIPEILYRGFTEIIVDDGKFSTQSRLTTSEKTTVYDLSAEYLDIGTNREFYLYLNNKQIAVVVDTNPIPQYNNIALFVRGSSRIMFENVYALADNFALNTSRSLQTPVSKIFGDDLITESEAIKKYAISGMVQNTYLSGISSESDPQYTLFYEEFGTIMREAAYLNIKYDRAYPALYAKLAETINRVRAYTVSGFFAGSYGAEFLIFNAADKLINLDDTSGNYLRILGIAFTQNTTRTLNVDDFFKKNSNFTNAVYGISSNPEDYKRSYSDIQNSRSRYGINEFTIDAQYIQTDDAAESAMDWIIKKVMYPRKTVGINVFATPHLQLGDIVTINYKDNGLDIVSSESTRFVVYNIENSKSAGQHTMTIHLAEV